MAAFADLIIATRGSKLAQWQAEHVRERLVSAHPGINIEINIIETTGDQNLAQPLSTIGSKGLFTAELEAALRDGRCDIAVHSLKDLPSDIPDGLDLVAVLKRDDPRDVLVYRKDAVSRSSSATGPLGDLKAGTVVGTSSMRRKAQVLHSRKDLVVQDLRGNVDTRLQKLAAGDYGAIILAAAGLKRLEMIDEEGKASKDLTKMKLVTRLLEVSDWLPAVAQGAIAVEGRATDARVLDLLFPLLDEDTQTVCDAERSFLRSIEGGCSVPVAAHAILDRMGKLHLTGAVFAHDGAQILKETVRNDASMADEIGERVANALLAKGASRLLAEARSLFEE